MKRAHLWPLLIALSVFAASSSPKLATPDIGLEFSTDKLAHFLVFGLIATSVLRIPAFFDRGWRGALAAACMVSLYGLTDEWRQSFTPGRVVELGDWLADTAGAFLAAALYLRWRWYRAFLELGVFGRNRVK